MPAKSINRIKQAQQDIIANNTIYRATISVEGRPKQHIFLTPNQASQNYTGTEKVAPTVLSVAQRLITGDELFRVKGFIIKAIRQRLGVHRTLTETFFCEKLTMTVTLSKVRTNGN
jgi:hypothetical protein